MTVDLAVPPNVTTDGEMEHCEFFGLPEQLNVTEPLRPHRSDGDGIYRLVT